MNVSSHTVLLPAGEKVPAWVHLIPAGTFKGETGEQTYHLRDAEKVIAASMTMGKIPLDENHSTQRAPGIGAGSPARGWIVQMQPRENGIWGKVDWTDSGTALMTDSAYRNLSPVFEHEKDGTVTRILSVALTNNPNLPQLTALHTGTGDKMDRQKICTALGIAGTTDDAGVLTALQTAMTKVQTLEAQLAAAKDNVVPVSELVALQTQLDMISAERKAEKAAAFVDAAIKAGKPIAAVRANMIAMHTADPAGTEVLINGLISINAGGTGGGRRPPAGSDGDGLAEMTAEDMAVCTKMGLEPKQFAETKRKMRTTTEGSAA